MVRQLVVLMLCAGIATPAFAGPVEKSAQAAVQRAAAQQSAAAPVPTHAVRRSYLWPGAILFAAGMGVATYGFLHTTDGPYVEPSDASKLSNTKVGIGGLALAAGGGAVMLLGAGRPASSALMGGPAVRVAKRISW